MSGAERTKIYIHHRGHRNKVMRGLFGDGSDGDVTTGSTTLTRDMYYNSLTVNTNATIETSGYRIFAKEFIKINSGAKIQNNGLDGNFVDGGSPTGGGSGAPLVTYKTTPGVFRGGGDGGGDSYFGETIFGIGGTGGYGAASDYVPGSQPGDIQILPALQGPNPIKDPFRAITMQGLLHTQKIGGGSGGGGGGGGGGVEAYLGGAGGGGGGVVALFSPAIYGTGSLVARGGSGVVGSDPVLSGPGGGGGGGAIVIVTEGDVGPGVLFDVSGGSGGVGGSWGDGDPGTDGNVYIFRSR